ncbi:MAG: c-type cytochrome [Roseateles asaccharophilus]|uniref:c-type cytochrome n=1 Tax=Roseateles asaccharophilus TaxID=582607 RepID=UPI003919C452
MRSLRPQAWRLAALLVGLSLVILPLALLSLGGWFGLTGPASPTAAPRPTPSPDQLARGAYLARAGNCMGCHTARGDAPYAGGRPIPTPFGTVFSPNLTPDPATGLGLWSAEDFWRALHQGRGRDGRLLNPAFPYDNYTLIRREDSDALYDYLRSLAPVARAKPPDELRFPYNTQAALAVWRALFFRPGVYAPEPDRDAVWNRGAYLVQGLGHCSACHGSRNALGGHGGPTDFRGDLLQGLGWYAPSLQDPAEAGVAHWSPLELKVWLRDGRNAHASALGPMAEVVLGSTQHLSDPDLDAMARYLRDLPQREHPQGARPRPETGLREQGAKLYEQHCAACHGQRGEGVPGIYPALAGNRSVTQGEGVNLLRVMLRGAFAPATTGNPRPFGMPPFAGVLSDQELAAVASHVRNSWGNTAGDLRAVDVIRLK